MSGNNALWLSRSRARSICRKDTQNVLISLHYIFNFISPKGNIHENKHKHIEFPYKHHQIDGERVMMQFATMNIEISAI